MDSGFGVDVGGSGIKGAPVDLATGELLKERVRIETPQPSTPEAVVAVVEKVLGDLPDGARIGMTLPSVVVGGTALTAANIDPSWVFTDVQALVRERTHHEVLVVNDADAAGVAEVRFGAARDVRGTVLLLTLGTGIGSALFLDGKLMPNTELGHLELNGADAELHASDRIREEKGLKWDEWASRLQDYLLVVERLLSPDLIVIGGGVSKKADKFLPNVKVSTPVVPAVLQNNAGIVGAAMAATGQH
jgi:polyphosphate glucokinase